MTPDRWRQVTEIFHAALARDAAAREAFLRGACQDNPSLRVEVDALIAAHADAGSFGGDPLFPDGAPRLSAGTRLGTYEIEDLLGVGGMGEVYRARDTELGRRVAIKILPAAWLADPDRRARLDKEARVLAALNHPHVAAIYGIAEADGVRGLVLELVEGVTLAERLTDGPLPVTEALRVAVQIADALDATHVKGIVHRDLKPGNIKIAHDGVVKVLDFGLAKAGRGENALTGSRERSTTGDQTRDGLIVGTAAYMSPEQARGQSVDRRTDIWAFGCVLYEMLTGRRAFDGETPTDVLAAIIEREPDWSALPGAAPFSVVHLLKRCLEKDTKQRLRDIGDAAVELEETQRGQARGSLQRIPWLAIAIALLGVAAASLGLPSLRSRVDNTPPDPSVVQLTSYPGMEQMPSLSPDGTRVTFRWNGELEDDFDIYVKLVGPGDPAPLMTDPAAEFFPRWSPDGNWIAFTRAQKGFYGYGVYVIPAMGGAEQKVGDVSNAAFSWLTNERALVVSRRPGAGQSFALYKLSVESGALTQLTFPPGTSADIAPAVAPKDAAVAFARFLSFNIASLMSLPLSQSGQPGGEPNEIDADRKVVLRGPSWSADGRQIIYWAGWNQNRASLWRVAVAGDTAAEPLTVAGEGAVEPDVSRDGRRLVFSKYFSEESIWSLELDEAGRAKGQAVRAFDSTKREQAPAFTAQKLPHRQRVELAGFARQIPPAPLQ